MNIKLDENIPTALCSMLSAAGHTVDTVADEGLRGQNDDTIWKAAQQAERFFVTQDLDFSDIRCFLPGTHFGIMLVRLKMPGKQALTKRIADAFAQANTKAWSKCFIVLSDSKIRVISPK